jgi:S-adenosylhomocysteine hydrolase
MADIKDLSRAEQGAATPVVTSGIAVFAIHRGRSANAVHSVPSQLDQEIAQSRHAATGRHLDRVSSGQQHNLRSREEGT